ncbi:MAG: hypothetical protein ACRDGQ_01340 [Candidatus Limnocylindrales bacterium]
MGVLAVRSILGLLGTLFFLAGLFALAVDGERFVGLIWLVVGGAILLAVLFERSRYRSEPAEAGNDPVGPGGGEPLGLLPPGFRATDEVFVDPSSGQRMRVYAQASTGARRYLAEGRVEPGDRA